jgi:glycosyltransferase involved in cell wall biosynthesis
VVVTTYDRPDMLERAITSVANQTYDEIEFVVVDDCSPEPVKHVVDSAPRERFTGGVTFVRHEENQGGSAARNTGIEAADGDYVAFLDDDDRWEEEKVEKQVDAFQSASDDVGLVYTGVRQVDGDDNTNAVKTPDITGDVLKRLLCGNFIGTFSAVMVSAEVVDTVGYLDERFPSWQDWEWYIRVATDYRFDAVPEPLVVRRNEFTDQVSADFESKREESYPQLLEKYESLARERFGSRFERKRRGFVAFALARAAVSCGEYGVARRLLVRSIAKYPVLPRAYLFLALVSLGAYSFEPARKAKRFAVRTGRTDS